MLFLVLAITIAALAPSPAPSPPAPVSAAGYRADAAILRRAYEALHPGLYRYTTPAQTAANFADLDRALAAGPTLPQACLAFSRFTATVRCGHSYPNFFNQPPAIAHALFDGRTRLPFTFVWLHGHLIVTGNASENPALAPGTDVLAIDGRSAPDILRTLLPYVRADGSNDDERISLLGVSGAERYEEFDVYFGLLDPPAGGTYTLTVQPYGSAQPRTVIVAAQTTAERAARLAQPAPAPSAAAPLWTFSTANPRAAILTMPTWVTYNTTWDWQRFLNDVFATLARNGTPNLIVDLRGNGGGSDVGEAIVAHLIDAPLATSGMLRLVRYRAIPAGLAPYLDTWDPAFKNWGTAAKPYDARFFRLVRPFETETGEIIEPLAPRYHGRVWILVDASNSSATFQFEQLVHTHRLATLVGTPTGGNQRGINGGAFFFVRLPNSHIEVDLPLIAFIPDGPAPDAGLTPDIIAEPTQAGIATHHDTVLQTLLPRL